MFILCNAGLCYFTQCVYCKVFIIFWSNNKVCGIHICFWLVSYPDPHRSCGWITSPLRHYSRSSDVIHPHLRCGSGYETSFWPISFVRAVRLARFVSSVTLLIRTLKCSGTSLESSGKKETVTPGLAVCPKFAHCFCNFSKLLLH